MTYVSLGKLKKNSVGATLSTNITAATLTIPVSDVTKFYDDSSTLITKGIIIGGDNANSLLPEEITITGVSSTAGAGNLTGATRGVNADGTIGAAAAWAQGTNINVTFASGIYNQIRDNFTECFQRDGSVALTGSNFKRNTSTASINFSGGAGTAGTGALLSVYGSEYPSHTGYIEFYVPNAAKSDWVQCMRFVGVTDTPTPLFAGFKRGANANTTDGASFAHGCGTTPLSVVCTPSVAGEMVSVTSLSTVNITVALRKHDNSTGTSQTVYWMAWV